MQKDKSIFKLEELPIEKFANSLGLPGAPKIKFISKEIAQRKKNASRQVKELAKAAKQEAMSDSSSTEDWSSDDDAEENLAGPSTSVPKV